MYVCVNEKERRERKREGYFSGIQSLNLFYVLICLLYSLMTQVYLCTNNQKS